MRWVVLAGAAALASCGDAPSARFDECLGSLSTLCAGGCPTEAEALETAGQVCSSRSSFFGVEYTWARCEGGVSVLRYADGFSGSTEYYRNGELFAAAYSTDYNGYCDGRAFSIRYGRLPGCAELERVDLCAE